MRDAVATEFFGEGVGVGSDAEFAKAANAWAVKNRDFQKLISDPILNGVLPQLPIRLKGPGIPMARALQFGIILRNIGNTKSKMAIMAMFPAIFTIDTIRTLRSSKI
jgi:hypothetical protein